MIEEKSHSNSQILEKGTIKDTEVKLIGTDEVVKDRGIQVPPKKKIHHIPCLFLPAEDKASKIIIYFHGNAEDIGLAFDLLYLIGQRLKMHVLAVEYPGYGLYKTTKADE